MQLLQEYVKLILEAERDDKLGRLWDSTFEEIRAHRLEGAPMPEISIEKLAIMMAIDHDYPTPREAFHPTSYKTFDDWFLRRLTSSTLSQCINNAKNSDVCCPVEGRIMPEAPPNGRMTLKRSMIEVDKFLHILEGDDLIQIALKKTDYHRVHSPFDGMIVSVEELQHNQLFEGSEAMVIFDFETSFGPAKLLCIGEATVQTFVTDVQPGTKAKKMQELGYFNFGSQVIIVLPHGLRLDRSPRKMFPGDPIGFV